MKRSLAMPFVVTASLAPAAFAQTPDRIQTPKGEIVRGPNGYCQLYEPDGCPRPKDVEVPPPCNPPPPQHVVCPDELLVEAGPNEVVAPMGDGRCGAMPKNMSCPPGATCNPPPPRRVNCDTREPVPDDPRPPRGQPGPPP